MKFSVQLSEGIATVTSHVEKLDALHAPELKSEFVRLSKEDGCNRMILDLTGSLYCDSSGLSAVLIGNRLCRDAGGTFVLSGLQPAVERLVAISQLDKVLTIVPTAAEAFDLVVMEITESELGNESKEL